MKPSPHTGRSRSAEKTGLSWSSWSLPWSLPLPLPLPLPRLLSLVGALMWVPALMSALTACGPGVGGTGTGQSAADLVVFGATATSVCAAPLAGSLSCGTDTVIVVSSAGTEPVRYIDTALGANTLVDFRDNSVHVSAQCQRLDFIGDWGVTATQDQRYFGSVLLNGQLNRMPATLLVQADPASPSGDLIAVLRDAQGRLLLGPLVLKRAPMPLPLAPACLARED